MSKRREPFIQRLGRAVKTTALWIAPRWYARRVLTARALEDHQRLRRRDLADTDRHRGGDWLTSHLSPDSELEQDLLSYRERARDLYYTNPIMHGYVEGCVTNCVGSGVRPQSRIRQTPELGISAAGAKDFNQRIEAVVALWARRCDRTGRKSLTEIQRLAERLRARDGECLIVLSAKSFPGKPIPLAIEVVDTSRLETPPEQFGAANVRLGIERDRDGAPVAYWIRTVQPDDTQRMEQTYERVPADRVLHLFEAEDADQSRGVPPCHASGMLAKSIDSYEEAVLVKRRGEACMMLTITTTGDPHAAALGAAYDSDSDSRGSRNIQEFNPGQDHYCQPGQEPKLIDPGAGQGSDHATYLGLQHHKMAAGLQYPYELLLKSYGGTNYSSGRLSLLDGRVNFQAIQELRKLQFYLPLWEEIVRQLVALQLVPIDPQLYAARPEVFNACAWITRGWPWVDPDKETKSDARALVWNLDSRTNLVGGRGNDDEELQEQRLRERMLDADHEKALQEYRLEIGLDAQPPADPRIDDSEPEQETPPNEEEDDDAHADA